VRADDLRFSYPGPASLPAYLEQIRALRTVPAAVPALLASLVSAQTLTVSDEAAQICLLAAQRADGRGEADEFSQRRADILLARHLSPTGPGRTHQAVADGFGISRERVRQVCDRLVEHLRSRNVSTPALDRALRSAAAAAPVPASEIDASMRDLLGALAGIESLIGWAEVVGPAPR